MARKKTPLLLLLQNLGKSKLDILKGSWKDLPQGY